MELLKLLSTNEIVVQILSFLALFFLLRIFFWKRLLRLLDARREKISLEFQKIEDAKRQATELKTEYEQRLDSIDQEAKQKLQQAMLEAEKLKQELKVNAQQEADKIIASAKNDIKYEIAKAREGLKGEITDIVLAATERLLKVKVTQEQDRHIVNEFLEDLKRQK